jgi:MerR family copper efflux transcriptional regulator
MVLTIGGAASAAGVNVQTIRYYEQEGLLPKARRTPGGYRQYDHDAVHRLRFIKRAQELGFTLTEIRDLLALRVRDARACASVERKARHKIAVVETKIRGLRRLKATLERLAAACEARTPTGDCPVLEMLDQE